jgi:hypothetical protein
MPGNRENEAVDIFQETTMTDIIQQITANNAWMNVLLILTIVLVLIVFVVALIAALAR